MNFESPLLHGKLIKRYKRFMADVELDSGEIVTAHCANSGSMLSVNKPGSEVWLSCSDNPRRKLRYTWEMIKIGDAMVGVNTGRPNKIVSEAISNGKIKELRGYATLRNEVKYGKSSRIDIYLEDPEKGVCYVEVKNVTMKRDTNPDKPAEFPDAVTSRGAKHLAELSNMVAAGHRAVMFYLVQRNDASAMTIAGDIDPAYDDGLEKAMKAGVEVLCYDCSLTTERIAVRDALTFPS